VKLPKELDPEPRDEIAVAVTMTAQLSEKRSIVMQTYLPRDSAVKVFHDALDKLGSAIDRQEAKYQLEGLRVSLEMHEKTLTQLEEDYGRIDAKATADWLRAGRKGDPKLNANEQAQKGNAEQNIKRYRTEILKVKAEIGKCEASVAKVD
jgi:ribosomal 50S subunit-associated protein YjgA (DUF615 family)